MGRRKAMIKRGRYFITYDCNLRCTHCLSSSGKARLSLLDELEPECLLPIFKKFKDAGMESIGISGGEPFEVFNRTVSAVKILKDIGFTVRVFTNGTYPDKHKFKTLVDLGCDGFHVSLDGMEWSHEKIRGKGTWGKTVESLKILKDLNVHTRVVSMVTEDNIHEVEGFIELVGSLANEIYLKNINTSVGRAKQLCSNVDMKLLSKFTNYPKVVIKEFGFYSTKCDSIAVTPNGSIISCGQIQDYFGNGFKDNIEKIFKQDRICRFKDIKTGLNGAKEVCCDY